MTDYEWLTKMGLCHRCHKEKVAPGRKFCFGCLDKIRKENAARYNPDKAKEYQARRREIYRHKKEAGICVRCNKPATQGMYCIDCSIKAKRNQRKRNDKARELRHDRGLIPEERAKNGLCLWCGKQAMPGKKCCEEHSRTFREAGKKGKAADTEVNGWWKQRTELSNSKNG